MGEAALGAWDPITPQEVAELLGDCDAPWWIAGGYAIDALVGRTDRRVHDDIDVGVLARDQVEIRSHLASWDLHCADPPGKLRSWGREEILREPIHDVWAREQTNRPWRVQLVLNPAEAGVWVYRRDARIRRPVSDLTWCVEGIPYLAPEVQLLFKSKTIRPKDEQDLEDSLPLLDSLQRRWLREALELVDPTHVWLRRL